MRVLLSEGSGLTSRQVATRLGALGHHVEVLSSTPFCLTRFTRHVRALHRVPRFADDPMDVILTGDGPLVIDVNPRLVEPINALIAGVDLVDAMLELARGGHPPAVPAGQGGVRSRQLLLSVLGAAEHGRRGAVLRELMAALRCRGDYKDAAEELTPVDGDPIAALPLIKPSLWRLFHAGATGPYSLTPEAWRKIISASER